MQDGILHACYPLGAKTLHISNTYCCHHFLGSTPAACFLQLELSTFQQPYGFAPYSDPNSLGIQSNQFPLHIDAGSISQSRQAPHCSWLNCVHTTEGPF